MKNKISYKRSLIFALSLFIAFWIAAIIANYLAQFFGFPFGELSFYYHTGLRYAIAALVATVLANIFIFRDS